MNFRTVQSFGNEDLLVRKYDELMAPAHAAMAKADFCQSCIFAFSQFITLVMNAALFGCAQIVINRTESQ